MIQFQFSCPVFFHGDSDMVPWTQVREPFLRWMRIETVGLSVMHLLQCPAAPVVYVTRGQAHSCWRNVAPNSEPPETFFYRWCSSLATWQGVYWRLQAFPLPAGMVFLVSGEAKHFVHLKLNSRLMPMWCDRLPSLRGSSNARLFRFELNPIKCFLFCIPLHQLVPHLVPNYPPCPSVMCRGVEVCSVLVKSVSPRRLVLEVRLFPSPPCAVLSVGPSLVSTFFFLLPFRVYPASARVCVCVRL